MVTMNKALLSTLRDEMNAALAVIAEKHGIKINVGNATYSDSSATMKVLVAIPQPGSNPDANATDIKLEAAWKLCAAMDNMKVEWLGQTFKLRGKTFKIRGYDTKKRKFPVVAVCVEDGKSYCLTPEHVHTGFGSV